MTAIPKLSALYESSLASKLAPDGTSFTIVDPVDDNGEQLSGLYGFKVDAEFIIGDINLGVVSIVIRNADPDNPLVSKAAPPPDHRRGAPVQITDYPILAYLRELLTGNYSFPNKLKYAAHPAFSEDVELVDKKYVDDGLNNGSGNPNAGVATKGITKLSVPAVDPANPVAVGTNDPRIPSSTLNIPTTAEKAAMAGGGSFGAPGGSNKFITEDYLKSAAGLPVVRKYAYLTVGGPTTQFTITNTGGTTFRYTWNGVGTNPNISAVTFPVGAKVQLFSTDMNPVNMGHWTVTGSGANFFEVTNPGGNPAGGQLIGIGGFLKVFIPAAWPKPPNLKFALVEIVGGGGKGEDAGNLAGAGGGGGGYARKFVPAALLGTTETPTPGQGSTGAGGGTSSFGTHCSATGGADGFNEAGGDGGIGINGDVNIKGQGGSGGGAASTGGSSNNGMGSGPGGSSVLGGGGAGVANNSSAGSGGGDYGGGGSGAAQNGSTFPGGHGAPGIVIVTEYYS